MSNMPAWMAGHIGRRDSFATFGLPSYDDMMQDLNVRRCQDNWVRSVGSVMQLLSKTMTTKKPAK